ncbi:putative CCR4-associated factor 1 homolog 8 [Wolffia australiana]
MAAEDDVRQVWASNFNAEMPRLIEALRRAPYAAIDAEFPGFIVHTPRDADGHQRYSDLRENVERLKILQLGFSCFGPGWPRRLTWQINFSDFDESLPSDERWEESVELLRREGVDFAKTRRDGVDSALVSSFLRPFFLSPMQRKPLWVTFHGAYDVAYLAKLLLARAPLPIALPDFTRLLGNMLGRVVDVKHLARHVRGAHLGLRRLGESLGLANTSAHQAGAQSLLAGNIFEVLMMRLPPARLVCRGDESDVGILHGLEEERIAPPLPPTWEQSQRFLLPGNPSPFYSAPVFHPQAFPYAWPCREDSGAFFVYVQPFAPPW